MEKTTINQRIEALTWALKLSRRKFAAKTGLAQASINRIVSGEIKTPGTNTIEAILQTFPQINPTWLLVGNGEMFLTDTKPQELSETTVSKSGQTPTLEELVAELHSMRLEFSRLVGVLETQSNLLKKPSGNRSFLMMPAKKVA